jgi:DNA-binding NtrC family response regulator
MPLSLQPKLLRALQERKARPVGGTLETPFDVQIVSATNRDLEAAVEEQRFREDLYYRINVIHIPLPPLRVRDNDVLLLAQRFLGQIAAQTGKKVVGLSSSAAEKLLGYTWPGNVRELQNCIERAVALTRYEEIAVEDLPEKVLGQRRSVLPLGDDDPSQIVPLEEVERRYILKVFEQVGGNKSAAAQLLGLDRKTLYRRLERYGVAGNSRDRDG